MAKQLLLDATRGLVTPRAPWTPYAGVNCAFLIGEKADRYLRDPGLLARGVTAAAREYQADGIPLLFDLSVEAESLGCEVEYWEDNVPSVRSHPLEKLAPEEAGLALPLKSQGRWPVILEAARLAKPRLEELDCAMMGLVTGPLTLASHLAGVRIFTAVRKNKEFAHQVLRFAAEVCRTAAGFYVDMGCDLIAVVDPVASQIRPETFREFVTPYCRDAFNVINEAGRASSFFICGDCTKVLDEVFRTEAQAAAVDEQLNLNFVRDLALKHGKGFAGALKLTLALSLGLLSPREDALICLAAGGNRGFTLAPGCDIPFDTPAERLREVLAARTYFDENYPRYPESW
ncbi:MAG: uroporphyrinogen decarboxylase family protein [Pseudomonadota bacterium]